MNHRQRQFVIETLESARRLLLREEVKAEAIYEESWLHSHVKPRMITRNGVQLTIPGRIEKAKSRDTDALATALEVAKARVEVLMNLIDTMNGVE